GWPVVAANVPRPLASAVGRRGLAALDTLTANERGYAAASIECPDDAYRARFLDQMRGHSAPGTAPSDTMPTAMAERFYLAQCVKDETMAESVVSALTRAGSGVTVLHVTGAFHSDYGQGTVSRIRRRTPDARVITVSAVPVADPAVAAPGDVDATRADYIVFTRRPR
ncbi:MAG TPA: ChaN family lipoprotein, partial [Gemmatimonadaceae bacterium]